MAAPPDANSRASGAVLQGVVDQVAQGQLEQHQVKRLAAQGRPGAAQRAAYIDRIAALLQIGLQAESNAGVVFYHQDSHGLNVMPTRLIVENSLAFRVT